MAPYTQELAAWEKEYREPYAEADRRYTNVMALATLAGYPLGTYLGQRYFGERSYSFGDALMLYMGAGGGLLYGLFTVDLLNIRSPETGWFLMTTAAAGGALGMDRYIRGHDYTFGQSALMLLGGIAGGAFAAGVGVLLEIDVYRIEVFEVDGYEDYEEKLAPFYEVAVIAGSLGGFALTRKIIAPLREGGYRSGRGRESAVSLSLQPVALRGSLLPGLGLEMRW